MSKISVYSGMSIQDKCRMQMHPVSEVERANEMVMSGQDGVTYSNSPDFIMAIKYIGKKQGVETEFFLDGISYGNSTEEIFEDMNRSFDMINDLGDTED